MLSRCFGLFVLVSCLIAKIASSSMDSLYKLSQAPPIMLSIYCPECLVIVANKRHCGDLLFKIIG